MIEMQTDIPKLRFPEFKQDLDKHNLGEIANFSKGKGISKAEIAENGATECIRYGELYTTYGETIDEVKSRTNINEADLVISEANDVIIPASGETQIDIATASCVLRAGIALGGDLNIIKTKNNGVFLSYYLNSKKKLDIAGLAQGISVVHLYSSQLARLELNLPTIPEQDKIALFLRSIDEKLQALKKKKGLLETYKKGVMQKLFSQELRFKDENGKDFPDWVEKTVGEVVEFRNGKAHENDIDENGKYIVVNSKFISQNGRVRKYSHECSMPLYKDEIVMVMSDVPNGKALAKCFLIDENDKYTLNQRICALKAINCFNPFILYLINRNEYYLSFDSGVGQTNLKKEEVLNCPLSMPSSIDEQIKIANFLSAIEDKTYQCGLQIEKIENWKNGLLQKMFC
jgi:type I restriction enzyme S subunit